VFSFFKRKRAADVQVTFKSRVQRFWDWFAQESDRLHAAVSTGKSSTVASEVSAKVDELGPGFAWVFGPGETKAHESFTLSGEGVRHKQLLAQYWLTQAPQLPQWTFHSARQPGSIEGTCMEIGDRRFDPMEFWLTPTVDSEAEKIDLVICIHYLRNWRRRNGGCRCFYSWTRCWASSEQSNGSARSSCMTNG
jgi:hypothetical protein